jgi:hypothetical protein
VKRHVKRRRAIRRPPHRPAGRVPLMAALAHVATGALPEASGGNGGTRDDPRKGAADAGGVPCARRPAAERVAQCLGPHRQGGQRSMKQEQACATWAGFEHGRHLRAGEPWPHGGRDRGIAHDFPRELLLLPQAR